MDIDLFYLLAAAAGGLVGAAIGALNAFIFTGIMVIAGVVGSFAAPESPIIGDIAFGSAFGPHIAFAGGVAAVAYAAKRGYTSDGKDIVAPMAGLARADVLGVGAIFGVLGYLIQKVIAVIPWFGENTDSVALTVVISAILVRLLFGSTPVIAPGKSGKSGFARFAPDDDGAWVRPQEKFGINTVLGLGAGLFGAFVTLSVMSALPDNPNAGVLAFGISAVSLVFLAMGLPVPVTHHITLPASVAASAFYPIVDNLTVAALIGMCGGVLGAWVAEFFARLWQDHGDTHIDPPASAIWPTTTVILAAAALVG